MDLSVDELSRVKRLLGRLPNKLEQDVIDALWGEQCSRKSSKAHLSSLVSSSSKVFHSYRENIGAVDLGDDQIAVLSIAAKQELISGVHLMGARVLFQSDSYELGVVNKSSLFLGQHAQLKNRLLYFAASVEACLSCLEENLIVDLDDLQFGGLAGALLRMANRSSTGMLISLDSLSPEIVTKNQDGMLIAADSKNMPHINQIAVTHGLNIIDLGVIRGDGIVRMTYHGKEVLSLPATLMIENAPRYRRSYQSKVPKPYAVSLKNLVDLSIAQALKILMSSSAPEEVVISHLLDTDRMLAHVVLSYPRLIKIDPLVAVYRTVLHAFLCLSAHGAEACALAVSLNFGSPEQENIMTELKQAIDGLAHASTALEIPLIATDVNLFRAINQTSVMISMLGLSKHRALEARPQAGEIMLIIGELPDDYAGSELLFAKTPIKDLAFWDYHHLKILSHIAQILLKAQLLSCLKVVGRGGLFASLRSVIAKEKFGMSIDFGEELLSCELTMSLVSEDTARLLAIIPEYNMAAVKEICAHKAHLSYLGLCGGDRFIIRHQDQVIFDLDAAEIYQSDQSAIAH